MVSDTWLAACYWSDKPCAKSAADTVGIRNGNDHYLTNVIVFDYTGTGVEVLGADAATAFYDMSQEAAAEAEADDEFDEEFDDDDTFDPMAAELMRAGRGKVEL